MKKQFAHLICVEHNEAVTEESHGEFILLLRKALLLSLVERNILTHAQYRNAEEKLLRQRQRRARALQQRGGEE